MTNLEEPHIPTRFLTTFCPVIEIGLTASLSLSTGSMPRRCCSTRATVGATIRIQPSVLAILSAITIHATTVLPAAVGSTSIIDPDSASSVASSWYARASMTSDERLGWHTLRSMDRYLESQGSKSLHRPTSSLTPRRGGAALPRFVQIGYVSRKPAHYVRNQTPQGTAQHPAH